MPGTAARSRLNHQLVTLAAPVRGLNTTDAVAAMPPTDAVQCDNFISTDRGMQLRDGWRDYATGLGGEVRTIMSYDGSPGSAIVSPTAQSLLFAATDEGIFDIEAGGDLAAETPMIALSGAPFAGRFSFVQFTAGSGFQYLVACSEIDGGFLFDGAQWMKMTDSGEPGPGVFTGVDPAMFVQPCVYKHRLMFVERGTARAWVTKDPNVVGGELLPFNFGPLLRNGGMLVGLINWTQDDGSGVDDRLVVLGSSGDLAIYTGNNPNDPQDFANAGTWYIGAPPIGRRCFTTAGGNIFVLTVFGVVPVAQVIQGGLDVLETAATEYLQQLRKIQGLLNVDFDSMTHLLGWEIMHMPSKALLHINRPQVTQGEWVQYAFHEHNLAWSRILDIPASTFGRRVDEIYAGTEDGRVLRVHDGFTDGMAIDGSGSHEIRGMLTPAFHHYGDASVVKQALMMRVNFLASSDPGYVLSINRDFTVTLPDSEPAAAQRVGSLWNAAFWSEDFWLGSRTGSFHEWRSVEGMGHSLTPTVYVASELPCTIASIEHMIKAGGPL